MTSRFETTLRGWARPLVLTLGIGTLAIAGTIASEHLHPEQRLTGLGIGLVAVSAAMILIARRLPIAAFGVALAATLLYSYLANPEDSPHFLGLLIVAYLVGAPESRLRTSSLAFATLASFGVLSAVVPVDPMGWAWPGLAFVIVAALVAGQLAAELSSRVERRDLESREEEARRRVTDERLRIARELHDVIAHSISMINVQASVALHVIDAQPAQARAALITIKAASHDVLRDLRDTLGVLRDIDAAEDRAPVPRLDELDALVANVRRSGVDVTLLGGLPGRLPAQVDLAAYRIIQEALTNVVRHAPGAATRVALSRETMALVVDVENDSPARAGDPPERAGVGFGLIGMRERVRAAGGDLETGPTRGGGFRVTARLPLGSSA